MKTDHGDTLPIRTRFAPSPTGTLHIGGARTALFSWLYARRYGGKFVLRIEDTDLERSSQESVDAILQSMDWLGIEADEGPIFQTQRFDRYGEVIRQLLDNGAAYHCYCSKEELDERRTAQRAAGEKPRYDGRCRDLAAAVDGIKPTVRFRNPDSGEVVFDDLVRGQIRFSNSELDDLIIARSDGSPTYNLTVVVDDLDMQISHVIRGDDHINNTPRQINIMQALGGRVPLFAHVPMILGADGARLSKRHGAVGVMQYEEDGLLPEALLNYLVRLGWSHGDQEIFSLAEMIDLFDLDAVNKSPAVFDSRKLEWLNQQHIKSADSERLGRLLGEFLQRQGVDASNGPALAGVADCLRERAKTLLEMAAGAVFFYRAPDAYDAKAVRKFFTPQGAELLAEARRLLDSESQWRADSIHQVILRVVEARDLGLGKVAQPLRTALAGVSVSPPIDVTLEMLGREESLRRIDAALTYIEGQSAMPA